MAMTTSKRIPLPGSRVRGSISGRPVMALLDLLGRRWALRILFELRDGAQNFRALQASVEAISPSMLNTRLKELREARLLDAGTGGYVLTGPGQALLDRLMPVADWANKWAGMLAAPAPKRVKERAASTAGAAVRRRSASRPSRPGGR